MPTLAPPTTRELFTAFLSVGISGFGGVLPYARHHLVEVKRWITDAEMTEFLSLAQLLPGPNIVNVAIMLGTRFRGAAGAAAGVLGLMLVPLVLFLALGAIYQQYAEVPWLRGAFAGVGAAAAGLVLSVGIRFAHALEPRPWVIALAAAGFAAIVFAHVPLPLVVVVLAPLGVLVAWRRAA